MLSITILNMFRIEIPQNRNINNPPSKRSRCLNNNSLIPRAQLTAINLPSNYTAKSSITKSRAQVELTYQFPTTSIRFITNSMILMSSNNCVKDKLLKSLTVITQFTHK